MNVRILHIAPDYFSTKLYSLFFRALGERGIKQRVLVADNLGTQPNEDVAYDVVAYPHAFGLLSRLLYFPKQRRLERFAEGKRVAEDVRVVHAHLTFSAGYLALRFKRKYGIPYVVAMRNTDVNVFFRYFRPLRPLGYQILRESSQVICLSEAYRRHVETLLPEKYRAMVMQKTLVIPNGVDPYFLEHISRHTSAEMLRLIYVGKICKSKNVQAILAVAEDLQKQGYAISLCMVGDVEPEYMPLMNRPYIEYHPFAPKEKVVDYLRSADIFVMPSFYETFGLVYVEAMSQGLPVIYTRGQGLDGYFKDGQVGYAVSPYSIEELRTAILQAKAHYEEISLRCCEYAKTFDWQLIVEKYVSIYKKILNQ